ncbi:MAG: DUF6164 family protein [Gammaproteobacteria bacterium]|nr:MAG: DUF6164 family protein [Gammaproteobacteria bacterium]
MPRQIFRLRGVPDDEATEIRALLTENEIEYYETDAGNWGISMPAIWLRDEQQYQQARALIDKYQQHRQVRIHGEYDQLQKEGNNRSIVDSVIENPVRFIVYLIIILVIVYFSIKPFTSFGS